jgi:MYXO-CTERM domain-containing protein
MHKHHPWVTLAVLLATRIAHAAVTFPPDAQFVEFKCGNAPMTDAVGDDGGFLMDVDIVGDATYAAAYHAADAQYLYLRMRWDTDPAPGGVVAQSAWGIEFDLDNNPTTYELLVIADGTGPTANVEVYTNGATTVADSPTDPADAPPVATFTFANNARTVLAPGSMFGGQPDYFLDIAVPWTTLVPLGLDHTTSVHVWVGSSSVNNLLDGDLACHDGGTGIPPLDGTTSDATPADPGNGSGSGSGSGSGTDPGMGELVGGDCEVGSGGAIGLVIVVAFALRRRRYG